MAGRGEEKIAHMASVRNPESIRPLESLWCRGRNIIKNDVKNRRVRTS